MAEDEPVEQFDATDPAANANAERDVARYRREDLDVLRSIMHTKPGRAFLYRRLESCCIYEAGFVPGVPDQTAFNLGKQEIGKHLLEDAIAASIDLYTQMIKDQRDETKRLDEVRRRERKNREAQDTSSGLSPELMPSLPPPAGYPGGPPLPKRAKESPSE